MATPAEILQRPQNRRRVRWISALYAGLLLFEFTAMRIATLATTGRFFDSGSTALLSLVPAFVCLLAMASYALAYTRHQQTAQALQVTALLLGGSAAVALNPTSTPASGTFYVLALFLASRYGFLERRAVLKGVVLAVVFLVSVAVSVLLYGRLVGFAVLGAVAFVPFYTALWFFAAEVEIRGLARKIAQARTALSRNRQAVLLGRGVLGILHAFSSRVMTLERGLDLIRVGNHAEGLAKLDVAHHDITRMLESLKRSVVLQSHEEPLRHRVGDVLRDLVDLTRLTGSAAAQERVRLEVVEDFEIEAPPSDIHTAFDNVLQNALEAGARKVVITVGPDRTARVSNDGPPIPFCLRCRRPECMRCHEFREGRSTKPGGSGIGVVVAREIMSSYGSLRLSSTPQTTEVCFRFR